MSADPRSRRPVDADDEQEIHLGRYWQAAVSRWWLVLAGIVAGIVIGYLTTLGGGRTYKAAAVVYLGQPLAPGGGQQVSSPSTQLALVNEVALAESTLERVATQLHMRTASLRGNVQTKAVLGLTAAGKAGTAAPLAEVSVTARTRTIAERAARLIAQTIVTRESDYVDVKIEQLQARLVYVGTQLQIIRQQLDTATRGQQEIVSAGTIATPERLLSLQNFNNLIVVSQGRLSTLEQDQFSIRQLLKLAQDVEQASIVTEPKAVAIVARSRSNSMIVGAIVGLLLGIVAALLWEPLLRRVGAKPA